jgi:hypothetical protein
MQRNLAWIVVAGAVLSAAGCAQQYHWYQGGDCCTPYSYCPPAPLPYAPYYGCPTPIASSYVGSAHTVSRSNSTGPPQRAPEPPRADEGASPTIEPVAFSVSTSDPRSTPTLSPVVRGLKAVAARRALRLD